MYMLGDSEGSPPSDPPSCEMRPPTPDDELATPESLDALEEFAMNDASARYTGGIKNDATTALRIVTSVIAATIRQRMRTPASHLAKVR